MCQHVLRTNGRTVGNSLWKKELPHGPSRFSQGFKTVGPSSWTSIIQYVLTAEIPCIEDIIYPLVN